MRNKFTLYWIFGLLALLLVILPVFRLLLTPPAGAEGKVSLVESRLARILAQGSAQLEDAYAVMVSSKAGEPLDIHEDAGYTAFIYRSGILIFWSDNKNPADHDLYARLPPGQTIIEYRGSKYLISKEVRSENGQKAELVLNVPLSSEYPIANKYLVSGPCPKIFSDPDTQILPLGSPVSIPVVLDGKPLFHVSFDVSDDTGPSNLSTLLFLLAILFFLGGAFFLVFRLHSRGKFILATLVLVGTLLTLRIFLWVNGFPSDYLSGILFDSRQFAYLLFSPSLADLTLNILLLLLLVVYIHGHRAHFIAIVRSRKPLGLFITVTLSLATAISPMLLVSTMKSIYRYGKWPMDITRSLSFGPERLTSLLVFVALGTLFFMLGQMYLELLRAMRHRSKRRMMLPILLYAAMMLALVISSPTAWPAAAMAVAYLLMTWTFRLDRYIDRPDYLTYLYFFSSAVITSVLGGFSLYQYSVQHDSERMGAYAAQLLVDEDPLAEFLLDEAAQRIKNDNFIKYRFLYPSVRSSLIEEKIRRAYIPGYFEKYDLSVHIYDASGRPFLSNASGRSFRSLRQSYQDSGLETKYEGLYLNSERTGVSSRQYVSFIPLQYNSATVGFIILELNLRKIIPNSVFPELLVNEGQGDERDIREMSYLVLAGNRVISSLGSFNYMGAQGRALLKEHEVFTENGLAREGYRHLGMKSGASNAVIVSKSVNYFDQFYSNFSFFFLVNTLIIIGGLLLTTVLLSLSGHNINFATRVQAYINVAFFLPLIALSLTILSVISRNYREEFNDTYKKKAERVAAEMVSYLETNGLHTMTSPDLESELRRVALLIEADINLYDSYGWLRQSTRPNVYDAGLLSQMVNPAAYFSVIDRNEKVILEKEEIGGLRYNAVFVALHSYETGKLLGILSIPYFNSQEMLELEIAGVLSTTNNIFVSIFILFLLISYFASRVLTEPLRMIGRSLRRTSLNEENAPLDWQSNDEIGSLVAEYNKMIRNLEESKVALSKTEKETAWREMAKQVAHEIKNPLTPMKLKLQHLLRASHEGRANMDELTRNTAETLLDQVQTLDTIASSFSSFATMPVPIHRIFDLNEVVSGTVRLFNNKGEEGNVLLTAPDVPVIVRGDDRLMGQILSNLLINAYQSVPGEREARVSVNLSYTPGQGSPKAILSVTDNGQGIPEEIRDKVFLPNFSTKYTGSGIGLALAKRGIEHAEGSIYFETVMGEGTTFVIEIPVVISNEARA